MKKLISVLSTCVLSFSLINIKPIKANDDFSTIKDNLTSMITGKGVTTSSEQFTKKIKYIHDEANKVKDSVEKTPITNAKDNTISDSNLNTTFINLYKLALAYKTEYKDDKEKKSLYQKPEILQKIKTTLSDIYTKYLSDKSKTYTGNWYFWEISMPQNISKILILLENELDSELVQKYLKFMDESLRAGKKMMPLLVILN